MTYRQTIQKWVEQLETMYDGSEWLRDQSTSSEQIHLNELRTQLRNAIVTINKLDNRLTDTRAKTELGK